MPLEKARCERVAGISFNDRAFTELQWLSEYCVSYADPGAEGRTAPLFMAPDWRPPSVENRQLALATLVVGVQRIWVANGGSGGTWFDKTDPERNGRLINLIADMFDQVGVSPPSPRTLRRALNQKNNPRLYP